jgi:hypothetical protein
VDTIMGDVNLPRDRPLPDGFFAGTRQATVHGD